MPSLFHPELHPVLEAAGYVFGYLVFRALRTRRGDVVGDELRWQIIAAAAVGGLIGSRLIGLLEQAPATGFHWQDLARPGGKTIVGGLLGGWLAVELTKLALHLRTRTGDLLAIPLCLGIAIGRLGCFFAGLADDTYGIPTTLPWGIDFGDGIRRHPTQLYEFLFLTGLAAVLWRYLNRPHPQGQIFRAFLAAYLAWRLLIDFIKPQPTLHGMNMIQWACIAGLIALAVGELTRQRRKA